MKDIQIAARISSIKFIQLQLIQLKIYKNHYPTISAINWN